MSEVLWEHTYPGVISAQYRDWFIKVWDSGEWNAHQTQSDGSILSIRSTNAFHGGDERTYPDRTKALVLEAIDKHDGRPMPNDFRGRTCGKLEPVYYGEMQLIVYFEAGHWRWKAMHRARKDMIFNCLATVYASEEEAIAGAKTGLNRACPAFVPREAANQPQDTRDE